MNGALVKIVIIGTIIFCFALIFFFILLHSVFGLNDGVSVFLSLLIALCAEWLYRKQTAKNDK